MHADDRRICHVFVTFVHILDAGGLDSYCPTHPSIVLDRIRGAAESPGLGGAMDRHWNYRAGLSMLIGVTAERAASDRDNQTRVVVATRESAQVNIHQVNQT